MHARATRTAAIALGSLSALLAVGCTTAIALTDEGSRVSRVGAADTPIGCNLLGDVSIGVAPDASRPRTEEDLVTLMRNEAGQMGADHLVVESTRERTPEGESVSSWVGRGTAYACPEGAASPQEVPSDPDIGD